jgi:hypothetical protein
MNVAQVKSFLLGNGLPPQEAEKALASDRVSTEGTNTVLKPSDEFVFSLNPETRQRLYLHEGNGGKPVHGFAILLPQEHHQSDLWG